MKRFGSGKTDLNKTKATKEKEVEKAATKKKSIPVRIPSQLKEAMMAAVIRDLKNMRAKSRWVEDAIKGFIGSTAWKDQVLDGEMQRGNNDRDVFYVSSETKDAVKAAVTDIASYAKAMKEEKTRLDPEESLGINPGAIVRSAILWKLCPALQINIEKPQKEMDI